MSMNIPGRPAGTPTTTGASTTSFPIQDLPQEIQEHICSFISVRERSDIDGLARTDKLFAQKMQSHQKAADLLRRMDGVLLKSRDDPPASAESMPLLEEIVDQFKAFPSLRRQLFTELLEFPKAMRNRDLAERCCTVLWDAIPKLPEEDRADAIMALVFSGVNAAAGKDPFPDMEIGFQHVTIDSDKPQLIGLLSIQLDHCSETDFPAVMSALFKKVNQLPPREKCNALLEINTWLVGKGWKNNASIRGKEVLEKRYQQLFAAAYKCIAELPPQERIAAIGAWESPPVWNGDHRNRDEMSINLLRLIPSNTPANAENAQAIARQMQSNFQDDKELNSLARFRAVLGGIAHLSTPLQAAVLECWSHSENHSTQSGDLQWQAMSEACEKLPNPEKGQVLKTLACEISMVASAFFWSREGYDEYNQGDSAHELASNIERSRRIAVANHLEDCANASANYYESSCFPATAALDELARLTGVLPPLQRIEVLEALLAEENRYSSQLSEMSVQERNHCANRLRTLIASLPDTQAQQSLYQRLDTVLADAE